MSQKNGQYGNGASAGGRGGTDTGSRSETGTNATVDRGPDAKASFAQGPSAGSRPAAQTPGSGLLPALSLPKGGGAIRGIGEKFANNAATGTGSLTVPIATSPGRAGAELVLQLSYDSGAGNGPFGLGFGLSVPSITRK